MNFLDQNALWHLLWLLPLLLAAWIWARTRRRRLLSLLLGERASSPEHVLLSSGRRLVRLFIFLAALLLLVLTVARPSWGERLLPAGGKGRDLLVVFDVSKSMLCKDVAPSRLEHAKWFLRQLMQKNPSDRYGLVAFAGTAFLECPLTADRSSLFQIIDELNPGSIPLGGTNIQKALETAIEAFKAAESGHRAIILITDGDEGYGDAPAALAKLNEMKIPLFVVGVGDPSQPGLISVRDENGKGFKQLRDSKGELVKSCLNEAMLSSLAAKANGVYARSTATDSCLPQIEDAVRKLVPKEYETGQQTRPIERFYYPLLAAFVLLLLWLGLSERRVSVQMGNGLRSASGTLLLAALFLGISVSSPVFAQEAPKTEKQTAGSLPSAVKSDAKNTESIPGSKDPVTLYNIAWDAQKKNDNASAGTRYEEAINLAAKRPDVRAGAYQNYGVIRHGEAR